MMQGLHSPVALATAPSRAVDVYISVGSNVDPVRHLRLACRELAARYGRLRLSPVYRNAAEGFEGDDFLNMVIGFRTAERPGAIVDELERLHRVAGRVRGPNPFSPRTLDLDLLLYGMEVNADPKIRVPREDIRRYGFVLGPLADIAPDLPHPVSGETMGELWRRFDRRRHPLEPVALDLACA